MAYTPSQPPRLLNFNGAVDDQNQGLAFWTYTSPFDSLATVSAPGYFSNALFLRMQVGDLFFIFDVRNGRDGLYYLSSFTGPAANLTLLGGGGGSDITTEQVILSGSTATAALNQIVIFNSGSGIAKTLNAPAATGSLSVIEAVDMTGDAGTNNITFTPTSGSVIGTGVGQNQIYTNYASGKWRDTSQGWVRVS